MIVWLKAIAALQLTTDTVFVNHESEDDVVRTILRLNKSIAEAPVKYVAVVCYTCADLGTVCLEDLLLVVDFCRRDKYRQQALSVKTTGLKFGRDNHGARQIWQRMLQESRSISVDVAAAVVNSWPSPLLLYQVIQSHCCMQIVCRSLKSAYLWGKL